MSVIVTLKKGEGRTVKAGGMWIYDNEIESVLGSYENGDVVLVHDFDAVSYTHLTLPTNSLV